MRNAAGFMCVSNQLASKGLHAVPYQLQPFVSYNPYFMA